MVVAGEHNLAEEAGTEQKLSVLEIFVRDDFDGHDYVNDIALVHLQDFIVFDNETTGIICIPELGVI